MFFYIFVIANPITDNSLYNETIQNKNTTYHKPMFVVILINLWSNDQFRAVTLSRNCSITSKFFATSKID
jgi:hypothetical protein